MRGHENAEYIKWSEDGKFFIIYRKNLNAFENNILSKYFNHRNYNSFHRQLNLYNFRIIQNKNKDEIHFMNEKFSFWKTYEEIKEIKPIKKNKK